MKKHYIAILLFMGTVASAQVINFPDPNFKSFLITQNVDLNGDDEIDVQEASEVTLLSISGTSITSLEGLQYFFNVSTLYLYQTSVSVLPDLSNLTLLSTFSSSYSQLNSINLSNPMLLSVSITDESQLTHLTINSPHFRSLMLVGTAVSSLTVGPTDYAFLDVALYANQFSSLDDLQLDASNNYYYLEIDIELTSLDLSNFMLHGNTLYINSTTMTDLIWRPGMHLDWQESMSIWGPQLIYADFKNNFFDASWGLHTPSFEHVIEISGHPSMAICVDDLDIGSDNPELNPPRSEALYFEMLESMEGNPVPFVSPYCDQISGSNAIAGTAQFNCGTGASAAALVPVTITGTIFNHATATNSTGNYSLYSFEENVTIAPALQNPQWFSVTPPDYNFSFEDSGNTVSADFCISPVGMHPDLDVTILPINAARPGFDAQYQLVISNKGNQVQSGSVSFNYDDSLLDFVSAQTTPDTTAPGLLSWNFQDLAPFSNLQFSFTLNVNAPTETPAVNNGDILAFNATMPTIGDETPADNSHVFNQAVVGSFDPNDKQVLEGESVNITQSGEYLNYIVRFQNTGTFLAENVVIKDVLSDKLDVATLQVIGASHDFRTAISHERQVEFFFEGINLPASQDDEPASHGFVAIKVKPMAGVVVGDVIENTAEIYFDFNWPIITNTVSTEFTVLSVPKHSAPSIAVVPNPAFNYFTLALDGDRWVTISNMLGQTVANFADADPSGRYDVSQLPAGTYIVSTAQGSARLVIR